jgi:hypothetical protein
MKLGAELRGMGGLRASLTCLAGVDSLAQALDACAEDVRDAAAAKLAPEAPLDNRADALARWLTVTRDGTGGGGAVSITISTPLDYGWHLEHGSLTRPPAPWLAPALDEAAPSIRLRLREWLRGTTARR